MAKLSPNTENLMKFVAFRKQMGVNLSEEDAKRIFGTKNIQDLDVFRDLEKSTQSQVSRKINIANNLVDKVHCLNWVEYIGVSGSVAAGTVKEEDDIDLFIVVKNHRVWLYRGILLLKTRGFSKRVGDSDDKDKLCLNFYAEERGLKNLPKDIFTFHELSYLKTIYGDYENLISHFDWFEEFGGQVSEKQLAKHKFHEKIISTLLWPINFFAMLAQILFMIISQHKPNLSRLINGYKKGYLELFHENDFKEVALTDWESEYRKLLPTSSTSTASTTAGESTTTAKSAS